MPLLSIAYGVLLILLGLEGYTNTLGLFNVQELYSKSALLIPGGLGLVLVICGLLAVKPSLRMHVMHLAALVGLAGTIGGFAMSLPKLGALFSGSAERPSAVKMQLTMGVICLAFLVMCIRSFIAARRRRKAAGV